MCPRESPLGFALQVHTGIRSQPAFPALPWGRCCQGIRAAFDPVRDPLLVWEGRHGLVPQENKEKEEIHLLLAPEELFYISQRSYPNFS